MAFSFDDDSTRLLAVLVAVPNDERRESRKGDEMIERNFATWLARKNGLPADQIEDLMQESALAELQGSSGKSAAERLAKRLARRQTSELASELAASQPTDTASELAELLPASELAYALAVMSGELSRHDGSVSRRFARILEMARSNSADSVPSMV